MENLMTVSQACDMTKIERRTLQYRIKKIGLKPVYLKSRVGYYNKTELLRVAERKSPNGLISVMEIAKRYNVDKNSIRIRIGMAELQHVDTGYNRAFLYHESDLVKLLEEIPVLKYPKGVTRSKVVSNTRDDISEMRLNFLRGKL